MVLSLALVCLWAALAKAQKKYYQFTVTMGVQVEIADYLQSLLISNLSELMAAF